ncbi:Serine/threonine-protein kinase pim-2 [Anabarilius grahami]|uniref:non-specific serine/threonine protein kinase n=1 Tax=Anabarilius grahami TaxID=495550 RepID=A0A3N0YUT0_ANAGA|nr:Serine/threonine-protein kinase pim-2 [Anabarilius grahami]
MYMTSSSTVMAAVTGRNRSSYNQRSTVTSCTQKSRPQRRMDQSRLCGFGTQLERDVTAASLRLPSKASKMLFTLLGLVALFLRDRNNDNNDHPGQDDIVDRGDDLPPLENNDGLVALFLRDRNNDNNDHPGQDDIVDRGDDLPPLENNDGQTSQEIPSDPVVLPTAEEPITGGDPHVEEDHSLEEPMIGEPQVDEDCSEHQSLEEPTVGDPQVNDWSQEQSIQEPIIGEPEGDDDYQSLDVPVIHDTQDDDDWSDYQSSDEPVSEASQVDDDWSDYQLSDEPVSEASQVDDDWSDYQSLDEPVSEASQVDYDWSDYQLSDEPVSEASQVDDDWSDYQSSDEPVSEASQVDYDWSDYQLSDEPVSEASQVDEDWSDYQSLDEFVPGDSQDDDLREDIYYSLPEYSLSSQLSQLQHDTGAIIEINCYNYKICDQLGEGGFGSVFEATRLEDNVQVAVKLTSKEHAEYVSVDDFSPAPLEVALQIVANQEPRCPEIIQLLDWKDEADCYVMVLERPMPSQSVDDFLRNYTGVIDEDLARVIMRQAVFAAQTCCQRGVFHRDIKPENLLINPDTLQVKLIDFGCGAFLNSEGYTYFSGTRSYCPPEYKIDGRYHGEPATVWSLGVLLFEMLCWDFPKCADLDLIKDKLWTKDELSPECCDFICSCLQINPEKRIELSDVLLHDWFKTDDVENDNKSVMEINTYNYKMGDQLGEGGFGAVFEATRLEDNVQVAMKFVPRENAEYVSVDGYSRPIPLEVALHIHATKPRVPEIVQLLDWKDEAGCYIMVLERPMASQSVDDFLQSYRGPMDEEDLARVIMRQAVLAAQACCQHGVFHRDIKMENLLINPDTLQVKLIDFGCGAFLNSEGYKYFDGTEEYCPLEYKIDGIYHGEPSTVWSLGVLLFVMLCWDFPRSSDLDKIFKDNIVTKNGLSQECCDFIGCCLRLDPKKRIKLDDVLLHDWFKHSGPANQHPMLDQQISTPCLTSKSAPHAGPPNQHLMLDQQTSMGCWTSKPAPNQHPTLNQQTSTPCWTRNQHPMLNHQTSTPC